MWRYYCWKLLRKKHVMWTLRRDGHWHGMTSIRRTIIGFGVTLNFSKIFEVKNFRSQNNFAVLIQLWSLSSRSCNGPYEIISNYVFIGKSHHLHHPSWDLLSIEPVVHSLFVLTVNWSLLQTSPTLSILVLYHLINAHWLLYGVSDRSYDGMQLDQKSVDVHRTQVVRENLDIISMCQKISIYLYLNLLIYINIVQNQKLYSNLVYHLVINLVVYYIRKFYSFELI